MKFGRWGESQMKNSTMKFVLHGDEMLPFEYVKALYMAELIEARKEYEKEHVEKIAKKNYDTLSNIFAHSIITGLQMGAVAVMVAWGLPIIAKAMGVFMIDVLDSLALPLTKMIVSNPICL